MLYVKNIGSFLIDVYKITKSDEHSHLNLSDELIKDLVTVFAKHGYITDGIFFDYSEQVKCEQKDALHAFLIEAGKRIESEQRLKEQ
jgi:hypothetical protein